MWYCACAYIYRIIGSVKRDTDIHRKQPINQYPISQSVIDATLIGTDFTESFVLVSDDLNHSKQSVYTYMQYIFNHLKSKFPNMKVLPSSVTMLAHNSQMRKSLLMLHNCLALTFTLASFQKNKLHLLSHSLM